MKASECRTFVIEPVLNKLDLYSESAVIIMLGTAAKETHMGEYLRQKGFDYKSDNGAYGIFQIEQATEKACLKWLRDRSNKHKYKTILSKIEGMKFASFMYTAKDNLIANLYYQAAICRIVYLSISEPLPHHDDIREIGRYWNDYYNRNDEHGTVDEFVECYNKYVLNRK